MKQQTLYLICGPAGSGKTTWVRSNSNQFESFKHISRDEIRFAMLKEEDDYFKYEKKVFKQFIKNIQEALDTGVEVIYADATHINTASRMKTLKGLRIADNVRVIPVYFDTPLSLCLERNAMRSGRALVPEDVIKTMYKNKTSPIDTDDYEYCGQLTINYWEER